MITKPGKYGTLILHAVEIIPADPGRGRHTVNRWAYDVDHAIDRMFDDPMWCNEDEIGSARPVRGTVAA